MFGVCCGQCNAELQRVVVMTALKSARTSQHNMYPLPHAGLPRGVVVVLQDQRIGAIRDDVTELLGPIIC